MSESEPEAEAPLPASEGPLFPVEGKFKDEAERARIMRLPEVERESFLADRQDEIQQAAQSAQLRQLMASRALEDSQKKRKAGAADEDEDEPAPKRTAKSKTSDNIANYKRLREERKEGRARGDDRGNNSYRSPSPSDRGSDRDADGDSDEVQWDDRRRSPPRREPPAEKRDFDHIRVGRSNFSKICGYPGFEDAMIGCFCRVAIGPHAITKQNQYRMTQIEGFTNGREYKMEAPNGRSFKTTQYVILAHGKAKKEWPFIACSDGFFQLPEYDRYLHTMQSENLRVPAKSYLDEKCQDIKNLLKRTWTDAEITQRLQKLGWAPPVDGTENGDSVPPLPSQPSQTVQASPSKTSPSKPALPTNGAKAAGVQTQQERLAALNDRNRRANAEAIRKAQIEERKRAKQLQQDMRRREGTPDPLARIKNNIQQQDPNSRASTPGLGETKIDTAKAPNGLKPKLPTKKRMMDDEVLGGLDLGIDVDI